MVETTRVNQKYITLQSNIKHVPYLIMNMRIGNINQSAFTIHNQKEKNEV